VDDPNHIYRVQLQLDVPVAATCLRIAMRDMLTDRIGAMEVALPLAPESQAQTTSPQPQSDSPPNRQN
jgi:hypothetical protein